MLTLTGLAGCQSSDEKFAAVPGGNSMDAGLASYQQEPLREGDEISISSETVTNLNTQVKIPLNGYIDLPFIDRVRAAGKTTAELQEELVKLYAPQMRAGVITVKLIKADAVVYVSGAVLAPGKVPLTRPMTALDAVMETGGFDPKKARKSKVVVLRVVNGQRVSYPLDLDKALKGEPVELFYLKPNDIVEVPVRTFNW